MPLEPLVLRAQTQNVDFTGRSRPHKVGYHGPLKVAVLAVFLKSCFDEKRIFLAFFEVDFGHFWRFLAFFGLFSKNRVKPQCKVGGRHKKFQSTC